MPWACAWTDENGPCHAEAVGMVLTAIGSVPACATHAEGLSYEFAEHRSP